MEIHQRVYAPIAHFVAGCLLCAIAVGFCGCERKEKVSDVETPGGEVEAERSTSDGEIDVEVNGET